MSRRRIDGARGQLRVFLLVTLGALAGCAQPRAAPVVQGELDLSQWNSSEIIAPTGEFLVQWNVLEPDAQREKTAPEVFVVPGNVSSHWPSRMPFGLVEGAGCAVFSVILTMPTTRVPVALDFHSLHARVRATSLDGDGAAVNEESVGLVRCDPAQDEDVNYRQMISLPQGRRVRIDVAVATYSWGRMTLCGHFQLGSVEQLVRSRLASTGARIASLALLLGVMAAAIVVAFLHRARNGARELAILTAIIGAWALSSFHWLESAWPRHWIYSVALTIEHLAMPCGLMAAYAFVAVTLENSRRLERWVYGIGSSAAMVIAFAPMTFVTGKFLVVVKVGTAIAAVILVAQARIWQDRSSKGTTLAVRCGLGILVAGFGHDLLRSLGVGHGYEWMTVAGAFFAFSQLIVLILRYVATASTADALVVEVGHVNRDLKAQQELVSAFLLLAANEVREPAAAVVALAEGQLASSGRRIDPDMNHVLELVAVNGRRIALLACELGDIGGHNDEINSTDRYAVDAERLVRRAIETVRPLLARRVLEVRMVVENTIPLIYGASTLIERAIANILNYMVTFAEIGEVTVHLGGHGDEAIISISANGRFPEPGSLVSPFETVRRLAGAGLSVARLGLGLSAASGIARRHGGHLTIEVTAEVGAVARFVLPLAEERVAIGTTSGPWFERITGHPPPAGLVQVVPGGRSVLVVEDDATNRAILKGFLERIGYEVWLASDGEAAIDTVLSAGAPCLVMVDVGLPRMNGLEVIHVLRQRYDAGSLPILVVTARGSAEEFAEAFERGANDYMMKPLNFVELEMRLRNHERLSKTYRAMHAELDLRRRYEGEIQRLAERLSHLNESVEAKQIDSVRRGSEPTSDTPGSEPSSGPERAPGTSAGP